MFKDLHGWKDWTLAVIAPLVGFVLIVIIDHFYPAFTGHEDGPIEDMQAVTMFIAFGLGVSLLRAPHVAYADWVRGFFAIGVIASLYIALEEISYGQRIFGWVTPEAWDLVNDQQETNLHNTSAWLDQKPRAILEVGVIVGGIIIPLLQQYKPRWLPKKWDAIYPDKALFITALVATLPKMYERFIGLYAARGEMHLVERQSELQEFFFFYFILLYFFYMRRRYRSA